jgi:hypothetical protein
MLDEIAAARDVHDLEAAAHGEHGHVARERSLEQRQLACVALRSRPARLRMRVRAVRVRVDVGAAGEDQPVERVEGLLDRVRARRHEQRPPARGLDTAHVVVRDERRVELPVTPARRLDIRRDSDERPAHPRSKNRSRS